MRAVRKEPTPWLRPAAPLEGYGQDGRQCCQGGAPTQFIAKLGERLGFESTGVRLYEALISKFNNLRDFTGGPSLAKLEENMLEEHSHMML